MIVGASMGGLRTAESLRRSGFDGEITIVGAEKHLPYNRPPLSKALLAEDKELDSVAFKINTEELKADFILGNPAQSVDIENKEATLSSNEKLSYDFLVAATGLRSRKMDFQNLVESGRFSLRTYDDAKRIRSAVAPGKHSTSIPSRIHSRTNKKPGSLMAGVPASVTKATLSCVRIFSTRPLTMVCSLFW